MGSGGRTGRRGDEEMSTGRMVIGALIGFSPIILLMLWCVFNIFESKAKERLKRAKKTDDVDTGGDDRNAAVSNFSAAGAGFGGGMGMGSGLSTM